MFPSALLNPKLIAALVIAGAILGGYLYVTHLQNKVQDLTKELSVEVSRNEVLVTQIKNLTEAKVLVEARAKVAEDTRVKVQADLALTLKKLRSTPVPKECPDQIDFLWRSAQ